MSEDESIDPEESGEVLYNSCPHCQSMVEVAGFDPYEKIACPDCSGAMRVRVQFDHYVIKRVLGVGGMSQVFEAMDTTLDRRVALKILNRDNSSKDARIQQFEREATLTASISDSHVVRVFSVGRAQGNFYIAMEFVDGKSFEEQLRESGKLSELRALDLAIESVEGLRAAARVGLIHRDIKPGNILKSIDGHAKIVDFGLALIFESDVDEDDELWATPYYVPPEKLDNRPEDIRSDIYSLGATLFHLMSGRPMYDKNTSSVDELRELKKKQVHLGDAVPLASVATRKIIDRMIMPKPEARIFDYDELHAGLVEARELLRESFNLVRSSKTKASEAKKLRENRNVIVGFVVFLFVFGGFMAWHLKNEAERAEGKSAGIIGIDTIDSSSEGFSTGAESKIGQRFVDARENLINGEYASAAKDFALLMQDPRTTQPTANWAGLNAAFAEYLAGRPGDARRVLRKMRSQPKFEDMMIPNDQREYFDMVSSTMLGPWPVDLKELEGKEVSAEWGLAALLYGMKNWEHGRFESAARFFTLLDGVVSDPRFSWLRKYRGLVRDHVLDASQLAAVPMEIDGQTSKEMDLEIAALGRVRKMIRTEGRSLRFIDHQLSRMAEKRDELLELESIDQSAEQQKLVAEETAKLDALKPQLVDFLANYEFREAAALLESVRVTTDDAKRYLEDLRFVFDGARDFVEIIVTDLNAAVDAGTPFIGTIQLTRGGVTMANVAIVKATAASLAVDRGGAVFTVAFDKLPVETLMKIGKWSYDSAGGIGKRVARAKAFGLFCYLMKEQTVMENMIREAASKDEAFRVRFIRMQKRDLFSQPEEESTEG